MIAVDTNILVYAHRRDAVHHDEARRCVDTLAAGRELWAVPWPCLHEFLAVVTSRRALRPPSTTAQALRQVETWLASPLMVALHETPEHWRVLAQLLEDSRVHGGAVHDARIAALCIEHGVRELWTADRDFERFDGPPTFNPLQGGGIAGDENPAWAAVRRARKAGLRNVAGRDHREGSAARPPRDA